MCLSVRVPCHEQVLQGSSPSLPSSVSIRSEGRAELSLVTFFARDQWLDFADKEESSSDETDPMDAKIPSDDDDEQDEDEASRCQGEEINKKVEK